MSQAKVLTEKEIKKVVKVIDSKRHSSRNRCMFLMTHMSGARISEVASLRLCDVLAKDGSIKSEVYLSAQQTKGSKGAHFICLTSCVKKSVCISRLASSSKTCCL